jgi:hypothetical protein
MLRHCPASDTRLPPTGDLGSKRPVTRLLTDSKFLDDVFVSISIVRLQIIQQATPLADHHEQTPPGGVVLLVRFEVFGQITDPLTQNCNLDFRASGI